MSKKILCYGEILWDLLPGGPVLGGAPFNLAFRLAERGELVRFVSRVGNDTLGSQAMEQANKLGVDTSLVQVCRDKPTGTVEISLDHGEPDFFIVPDVAYDGIEFTEELQKAAAEADCICYGTLCQRSEISRSTLLALLESSGRAKKFCDINLRRDCYSQQTVLDSVRSANILKLNRGEVEVASCMMFGSELNPEIFAKSVSEQYGVQLVLVTLGSRGVLAIPADSAPVYVAGYQVEVRDTVGSGDAFSAGFLQRYLGGAPLARCCDSGCLLGGLSAARKGGTGGVSDAEIRNLAASSTRVVDEKYARYLK
jgi:fructokinase